MSTRVACQSCPITLPVEQFVDLVSGGWDMTHTFQRPEFNDGKVVVCRGRFAVEANCTTSTGPEEGDRG